MSELFLIRHGQASAYGPVYDELSKLGARQSARLGAWLAREGMSPTRVVMGPRKRHRQTCEAAAAAARLEGLAWPDEADVLEGLDEYPAVALLERLLPQLTPHDPELAAFAQISATPGPDSARAFGRVMSRLTALWMRGEADVEALGIPTWAQYQASLREALEAIQRDSPRKARVMAFTSAGTIAVAMRIMLDADPGKAMRLAWSIHNASVTRGRYSTGRPLGLLDFNTTPHLRDDPKLLTLR